MSSSVIVSRNNAPFLDRIVTSNENWILYDNWWWPVKWLDREEAPSTSLPKPNLNQKKVMVTVWWSASGLIHYGFLNPGKTVTSEKYTEWFNEIHRKPQSLQLPLSQQKGPNSSQQYSNAYHTTNASEVEQTGLQSLPHLPYSPDLSPTDYCFKHLNSFLQGNNFHNQQEAENAFEEFVESQSTNFYATGINKLILIGKKCVDCNGSYFD